MAAKVLLLEDDADQLEVLAILLSLECGRESVLARSYDELTRLGDAPLGCELALLDVNLGPEQPSGLDAYRWLRERGFTGRVCFLTGHARHHPLVVAALRMGDVRVVEKPVETAELRKLVEGRGA
jgi:DNA-binding NtrC family response regulator